MARGSATMRDRRRPGARARRAGGVTAALALALAVLPGSAAQAGELDSLQLIAHRGGNDFGPEHTMTTLRHAIAVGVDAIEVDVRFTKDNVPVLLHDSTLNRTTKCSGKIVDLSWRDLRKCNPGDGGRIPTLAEGLMLTAQSNIHLYLHVKRTDQPAQLPLIIEAIREADLVDATRVTTIADDKTTVELLKKAGSPRVGLVFNTPAGWLERYPVLIAYNTPIEPGARANAQRRGSFVITVQDHPVKLADLLTGKLGLDGYMANHVDTALQYLGRYLAQPGDTVRPRTLSDEPSDHFPRTGLDGA